MLCFVPVLHGCVWYVCCYVRKKARSLVWFLSASACGEVFRAIQEIIVFLNTVSKVYKDCSRARMKRDADDIQSLVEFFRDRKPLSTKHFQLRSLTTGLVPVK